MAKLGISDLKDMALPTGWDGAYITQQTLKDGTTFDEVFTRLATAAAAFNASLLNHTWLPLLAFQADEADFMPEYRQGARQGFEQSAEYAAPTVARSETSGHLIPLYPWDRALAWTWQYLRKARLTRIEADLIELTDSAMDIVEVRALRRLFRMEDDTVGSAGHSPGFVTAASSITYTPPEYKGQSFTSSHEHYLRQSTRGAAALAMARHLVEHGHQPPYEMFVHQLDAAAWAAVSDDTNQVYFRPVQDVQFQYAVDETIMAPTFARIQYFGALDIKEVGPVLLRGLYRVPDEYCAMFKPYGANDMRNPLWWRGGDDPVAHNLVLYHLSSFGRQPDVATGFMEFGFGVGMDRTNGVLCQIAASGSYTTPTIS